MNIYQFNYYALDQRAEMVWQYGSYLAVRHDGGHSVVLYHMGEFFAEVWYSPEDNQVKTVRGFKSKTCLEPYLQMVSLEELMGEK
ncbi:hypothetical protein DXT99_23465 [Pontibacter diazotrophicus]|uniref:Uncharacterized protein n=1 Tax=Pontibacter diazotrophicus TaxID=1400979 RepID=A0A3D8L3E3_9BACT|nr:hypothetical protein [Pontibacter diazotrophicus]RDV11866.1 hypothetical protein DXT99_23465 [Pontibacter diazotrophicus]